MQARLEAATRARQATEEEKAGLQRRLRKATDEVRRLSAQCQIAAEHAEAVVSDNLKLQERIDALEGCRRDTQKTHERCLGASMKEREKEKEKKEKEESEREQEREALRKRVSELEAKVQEADKRLLSSEEQRLDEAQRMKTVLMGKPSFSCAMAYLLFILSFSCFLLRPLFCFLLRFTCMLLLRMLASAEQYVVLWILLSRFLFQLLQCN